MKSVFFFFLLLCSVNAAKVKAKPDTLSWCSAQHQCLGGSQAKLCQAEHLKKNPNITYSLDFCDDPIILKDWGVGPTELKNVRLWELIGKEYRMEYLINGLLPINIEMMEFLFNELPWTAQLINAYQNTKYSARFINNLKTRFKATNGANLSGLFEYLLKDSTENRWVIQGEGFANVLKWRLKGDAVVTMDFDPINEKQIAYDIKCMAFPGNAMINGIMELDFFEDKVMSYIQEIVKHITLSAERFADGDRKAIENHKAFQTIQGKLFLKRFTDLLVSSGYSKEY